MDLQPRRSKAEMISDISKAFSEYEEYKSEKVDKYTRCEQLGEKGKEGTTYLVKDGNGKTYAMKTFRKGKSSSTLYKEYSLQKKASKAGVAPHVYEYDTVAKWILMEKMDSHLYDHMVKRKGVLSKKHQERLIEIFQKLDEVKVFHNDANICNYMLKDGQIYLIDYGFSKEIDSKLLKKLKTDCPNSKLMLIGLIMKLKEMKVPEKSYKYLKRKVDKEDLDRFQL
jgi:tRNA A-37 threonylcarbamoyl transferase component Bud32